MDDQTALAIVRALLLLVEDTNIEGGSTFSTARKGLREAETRLVEKLRAPGGG